MARPKFVQIAQRSPERFKPLLGADYASVDAAAERARRLLEGRAIWHISSTMRGGGVAEMLHALLPYVRGAGIDTRWVVLRERPEFFELTKRLHNNLHGERGDGGMLGGEQRAIYEGTLATSSRYLAPLLREGDVVFLHDPQTAGLAQAVRAAGARVVWRCHIGADHPNEVVRRAWEFLTPYIDACEAYVFSRSAYIWETLEAGRAWVMAPCIDPFSPKNQEMDRATVEEIVGVLGLGEHDGALAPTFCGSDGTPARVERGAEVIQEEPLREDALLVAQISRWDRLKDHRGLLRCFEEDLATQDLHLLLAGPATAAVADDPEGAAVWDEIGGAWHELSPEIRRRVHLVSLPMDDLDENAAMVNALQRRADIVVQKSLAEGFGLTVAEAMWKRRPVIGACVGGIQDQIVDGVSGLLISDPRDLDALAKAILALASDRGRATQIGERARQRVFESFLAANRLAEYAELVIRVAGGKER